MRCIRAYLGLWLLALLAACGPGQRADFKGTDISGAGFGRTLELADHNGTRHNLTDFRGKLVVLFFGYTHCPDVCPTTLADMAAALKLMAPADAARVQVLFVSVDPERDSADVLRQYVPYFHAGFLGMTGTADEIAAAAREFHVQYRKHVEAGSQDYLVDHTAGSYVLDSAGRLRLFLPYALPPPDIAHDLSLLLRE